MSVICPKRRKTDHIPDDIKILILARLPLKSLLRFSCVCKTWKALFRTHKFISEHRQMYNSSSLYLVYMRLPEQKNDNAQTICTVWDGSLKRSSFVLPINCKYVVAGYYDGLILIRLGHYVHVHSYCILNFVGILKRIGEGAMGVAHMFPLGLGFVAVGFGFAERSGDYRVLKIRFAASGTRPTQVETYSLGADRWTVIKPGRDDDDGQLPFAGHFYYSNVCFKGSIYFMSRAHFIHKSCTIVRLDLDEEVFREVAPPPSGDLGDIRDWQLTALRDMLALLKLLQKGEELRMTAWLLKEESKSWTAQTHHFDCPGGMRVLQDITVTGQIVVKQSNRKRPRYLILTYDGCHHEFKLTARKTSGISEAEFSHFVVPINKESLFLMDQTKSTFYY